MNTFINNKLSDAEAAEMASGFHRNKPDEHDAMAICKDLP